MAAKHYKQQLVIINRMGKWRNHLTSPSVLSKKDSAHSLSQSGSEESPLSFVLFTVAGFLPLVLYQRRLLPEDLACSYSAYQCEHWKNVLSAFEHFLSSLAKGSEATAKVNGV